jgi:hypothetical protein
MAKGRISGGQVDFTSGELDPSIKRNDTDPRHKAGARQMSNWRILASKGVQNRPGRRAIFLPATADRISEVLMAPGQIFFIAFGAGTLRVYNAAGALVFTQGGFAWSLATFNQVVHDTMGLSIYITFPGQIPQVLTWDGVSQTSTWTVAAYAETIQSGQKRTPFFRISPKNITLLPSGISGSVTLTFSASIGMTNAWIGTRIRYGGTAQFLITAVASGSVCTATVQVAPPTGLSGNVNFLNGTFNVGDVIIGSSTGARGVVTSFSPTLIVWQPLPQIAGGFVAFNSGDVLVGPNGNTTITAFGATAGPQAILVWDDEVMNTLRGWPASVRVDQSRLIFSNIPSVPNGIIWSAINTPNDLFVDTLSLPTTAMFELAPGKSQVLFVEPGADSNEFVFTTQGIYYIPISVTNPLKPGSVAFNLVSRDGASAVQPRQIQEVIVYINAGNLRPMAIVATGSYSRPYESRDIADMNTHLFTGPVAIAAPSADGTFPERYAYVLNADGTIAVGAYDIENGQIKGNVGWLPWVSPGNVKWLNAQGADLIFSTSYSPNGITPVAVCSRLDDTIYLDGAMFVNAIPTALTPPGGKGPFWWIPLGSVDLMDQSTRMMGTYQIDANGFIVPQFNGGENLTAATLIGGQTWSATLEPWVPIAPAGQYVGQRMAKRRITRFEVYYMNSTGFLFAKLYSDKLRPGGPALGAVVGSRRIATWNQEDDPTLAPPLREDADMWRPLGRSHDPRACIIKDTPGPLLIAEVGIVATV